MAEIKIIRANNADIYPVTHEDAVVNSNGLSVGFTYQPKTDNFLSTTAKTIAGGINEVNSEKFVNEAQNGTAANSVKIRYVKNAGARMYPVCNISNALYTNGETLYTTVNTISTKNTSATTRTTTAEKNVSTMQTTNTNTNGTLTTVSTAIGSLKSLETSATGNLVAAVNEINQFGSNLRDRLRTALSSKGLSPTTSPIEDASIEEMVTLIESDDVGYELIVESSYTVESVSGASYGFTYYSSTGYWVSDNAGINSSAALCKVIINNPSAKTIRLYFVNYAEEGYDYGMVGNMGVALSTSASEDSDVRYSCSSTNSESEQYITLDTVTSSWFHVKYIKDSSVSSNNDNFAFRIEFI